MRKDFDIGNRHLETMVFVGKSEISTTLDCTPMVDNFIFLNGATFANPDDRFDLNFHRFKHATFWCAKDSEGYWVAEKMEIRRIAI